MMNMNVHAQASRREKERENRTQVTARTVTPSSLDKLALI
jgi:hypothetical protein